MKQLLAIFVLLVGVFVMSIGRAEKLDEPELTNQTGIIYVIQDVAEKEQHSISRLCFYIDKKDQKINSNLYGLELNPMTAKKKRVRARPKREKSYEVHFVHLNYFNDLRRVLV